MVLEYEQAPLDPVTMQPVWVDDLLDDEDELMFKEGTENANAEEEKIAPTL